MPKTITYKANSIIYFQGDQSERIFILKSGKVLLKTIDIDTGKEVNEIINMGEFFGVKSALGRYIRDETCVALTDAEVLVLSVAEFEQLALSNTRIIMKMLKVFSNQLRRIHHKVEKLLNKSGEETDPETGLFHVGDYYFNSRQFRQAAFALNRYLTYYPQGKYASQASLRLQEAERYLSVGPGGSAPRAAGGRMAGMPGMVAAARPQGAAGGAKEFYQAVGLISQEKYQEALDILYRIVSTNSDPENLSKAEFEVGRCLTHLKKYDEAIRHFTALIQKYPKHPDLKEALFLIGRSYEGKGDKPWARNFYEKIVSMSSEDEPTAVRARKALQALGGGAA